MRLFYRGVGYDYEPVSIDKVETGQVSHYRGQSYVVPYPHHIPACQPLVELTYRGVTYRTTATGTNETLKSPATPRVEPVTNSTARLRQAIVGRQVIMSEVTKTHRQNIQRLLQRRLDAARAKGDETLIHQLEQEMQSFS
jgi:hypothetical protein